MNINLAPLSIAELEQLIADAHTLIEKKKTESIRNAKEEIAKIASAAGVSLDELLDYAAGGRRSTAGTARKGTRKPAAIKYRNTDNPEQTWSGRGKRPNWLQEQLAKGRNLEDFAV